MKKKICFVITTPVTASAFLLKHFEFLSREFEVYLVANFENNQNNLEEFKFLKGTKNIKIFREISIVNDFRVLIDLKDYLIKEKFDAVHTVTPKAGLIGMIAAKFAGVKLRVHIFTGQVWYTKTGLFKILLKNLDRLIVFFATDILIDGHSQRDFLIKNRIIRSTNSLVLGNGSISGVDCEKFIPQKKTRDFYRAKYYITEEVVFLFLGRLNLDKGIMDLAYAFVELNKIHPKSRLVFVGSDESDMKNRILKLTDSNPKIIFYGFTNQPSDVLQMADVFCLPSYREGFGTSIIEASLLGKPIICSNTYGLMDTIIENETGLRHEVKNVNSIIEQMIKLMNNNLRKKLGDNGRKFVLNNFSAENVSKEWLEYYKYRLK